MPEPPMPSASERWALFLDVDGTLAPIAPTPGEARIPPAVVERLGELHGALDGALALVSGRPIAEVDRMVAPVRLPAAGVHGAEWRPGASAAVRAAAAPERLAAASTALGAFAREHRGTLFEDKRWAVALHFRGNPGAGGAAAALAREVVQGDPLLAVLEGHMVVEVRLRGVDKGGAVRAFMDVAPFAGRRPVYVGDDTTDEDAFAEVNARRGIAVIVGTRSPTGALHRLASVRDVHSWLDRLARHLLRHGHDE